MSTNNEENSIKEEEKTAVVTENIKELNFDNGLIHVVSRIQALLGSKEGIIFVAIAGAAGSGKTFLAKKLQALIPDTITLCFDDYIAALSKQGQLSVKPFDLLCGHISKLKQRQSIQVPALATLSAKVIWRTIDPAARAVRVVVVDGKYTLQPVVSNNWDLRISISGGALFEFVKTVYGAVQQVSVQHPHETLRQVTDTVYPIHKGLLEPSLRAAEVKIMNYITPFVGFLSPSYSIKGHIKTSSESSIQDKIERLAKTNLRMMVSKSRYQLHDTYIVPPGETAGQSRCTPIRIRTIGEEYSAHFAEMKKEKDVIISPSSMAIEVDVKTLAGLLALGYTVEAVLNRSSVRFELEDLDISIHYIEQISSYPFIHVKGTSKAMVTKVAAQLGLSSAPFTYIELYRRCCVTTQPNSVTASRL